MTISSGKGRTERKEQMRNKPEMGIREEGIRERG